ncbi:Uu.00g031230.m01.CDS01 [Anthostomella pinea]|uniref:Uu.00g031230.m01.CDS01 n=1 Tax=Anthostomella pinea TaxID=933095 RepID=A0AAI8V8H2_9PEZI|nr:Uu.00g031230.m01.CDS01 [Anthostomella pinea]
MSTTPRSSSPAKAPQTPEGNHADQSMEVELPTHLEEPTRVLEDATVRLHIQPQSPSRTQVLRVEPSQYTGHPKAPERQRQTRTPEPQKRRSDKSEQSPGHLDPFSWDDFETRYEEALRQADTEEEKILEEFDQLVKYFNVWASASSSHDNERAIKRSEPRLTGLTRADVHEQIANSRETCPPVRIITFAEEKASKAEIDSFHEAHFSSAAIDLFGGQFLRPEQSYDDEQCYEEYDRFDYYEEEDEDDGLGYYPDDVKRTLTDEQVAIFRHSELEGLRRVEAKVAKHKSESAALLQEAKDDAAAELIAEPIKTEHGEDEDLPDAQVEVEDAADGSEDGEIEVEKPQLTKAEIRRRKKKAAKQKKKEGQKFQPEKKPDLRKRTWDVVEAGMDTLDYDELDAQHDAGANPAAQRRRISYDD